MYEKRDGRLQARVLQPRKTARVWCGLSLALLGCTGLVGGCQNARFKTKQDARDEHIRRLAQWYQDKAAERPASLDDNWKLIEQHRLQHVEKLDATKLVIKRVQTEDQLQWREGGAARQEVVRNVFTGRPENIRRYWHYFGY